MPSLAVILRRAVESIGVFPPGPTPAPSPEVRPSLDAFERLRPLPAKARLAPLLADGHLTRFAVCRAGQSTRVDLGSPEAPRPYTVVQGRPVKLGHGAIVEGSAAYGGLQPNYVIDLEHPELQDILTAAKRIGRRGLAPVEVAAEITAMVSEALRQKAYRAAPYLRLMAQERKAGRNISLGDYLTLGAGVCREHALITHLALLAAGVASTYVYVQATQGSRTEDHGIALFRYRNAWWIADAYNANFNGFRLKDVLRYRGTCPSDPRAPFAKPALYGCRARLVPYPRYYLPV